MLKDRLKIILKEFYETKLPTPVPRDLSVAAPFAGEGISKIITIIGPRRTGKTWYLFHLMKGYLSQGRTLQDLVYINFEDERLLPLEGHELGMILDAYYELCGHDRQPVLFLDEIQNVKGWERFVRRAADQGYAVFLSGSNSRLLGSEIGTAIRGRSLTYELLPFSFSEFLRAKGLSVDQDIVYSKSRHLVRSLFDEFLFSGGYPEICFVGDKLTRIRIFQDYFNAVFYRDLVDRYNIKRTHLLRQWMSMLLTNIAAPIRFTKVENDFKSRGIRTSRATLSYFAQYIEDVFFGFFVHIHADSVRRQQVNPRKFYLIDVGLHTHLTTTFSYNRGRLLENIVYLQLRRNGLNPNYYRTKQGYEVDFYVPLQNSQCLIQVCEDLSQIETYYREKRSLEDAMKALKVRQGLILTMDRKEVEETSNGVIHILPVWEWLLNPKGRIR